MYDNEQINAITPCDVCKYKQNRSKCFLCPHEPTPSWGELAIGCGCLIVLIVVVAFVFALLGINSH